MDTKERAEKIGWSSANYADGVIDHKEYIDFVISQLDEAVQEAKVKLFEGEDCCVAELERDMYYKGFASAQEMAAGIAEKGPPPGGIVHCDGNVSDPGVVVTGYQRWIAERIRAMEPK